MYNHHDVYYIVYNINGTVYLSIRTGVIAQRYFINRRKKNALPIILYVCIIDIHPVLVASICPVHRFNNDIIYYYIRNNNTNVRQLVPI